MCKGERPARREILDILAYSIAADTWQALPKQDRTMYWRDEVKEFVD